MKTLGTVTFLLLASSASAQLTAPGPDTLAKIDTLHRADSLRVVKTTLSSAPDAMGRCVMLPGDFDGSGTPWKRK